MKKMLLLLILALWAHPAYAFQCPKTSPKELYDRSERVFLIYVTETRLNEKLWKEISEGYPAVEDDSESVKAIFADYQIVEDFKGDKDFKPLLVEMLGIGVGYVGLVPGNYYLSFLSKPDDEKLTNIRGVNICNTPFKHYRLEGPALQNGLSIVRNIRDQQTKSKITE